MHMKLACNWPMARHSLALAVDPSSWTRLDALAMKQHWETVRPIQLEHMTALILKMLESVAKVCLVAHTCYAAFVRKHIMATWSLTAA